MTAVNVSLQMNEVAPVRRELALDEGAISFLEWKQGKQQPALHFAHANGFNGQTYRRLLAPLAGRFHVRAWDARGHGQTSLPAEPRGHGNWRVFRDDLIRFVENFAAEAGGPVLLGGHSMGGTTSLMVAAERPDLVRGLILVDPVMVPLSARLVMKAYRALGRKGGPASLAEGAERRRAVFPDRATMVTAYKGRGAFRTWPEEVIADYVEGGTKLREDGKVELACAPAWEAANFRAQDHNIWHDIDRLRCPLTLLYAGASSTCRAPAPALLGGRDPEATILRIGQATHFLPMEYPDAVRREALALDARLAD
jgi:pimeloyl-ACP methyl ester carboxylesterase